MIWLVFAIMALGLFVYLAPVFLGDADPENGAEGLDANAEVATYFSQIDAVRANPSLDAADADAAVLTLQRQILKVETKAAQAQSGRVMLVPLALALLAAGALYAVQGRPDLTGPNPALVAPLQPSGQPAIDDQSDLATIVAELEKRLQTDRAEDPLGWRIYARSLMRLRRFTDAITAYDRAISLSEDPKNIREERASALAFITQQRGPNADDIAAADDMSAGERAAMIQGMVDNLAARLDGAPDDPAGWTRLIRSRQVLGQIELAERDIATVRQIFADDPKQIETILSDAGWTEIDR